MLFSQTSQHTLKSLVQLFLAAILALPSGYYAGSFIGGVVGDVTDLTVAFFHLGLAIIFGSGAWQLFSAGMKNANAGRARDDA